METLEDLIPAELLHRVGGDELRGEVYRETDLAEAAASDADVGRLKSAHDGYRIGFANILKAARVSDPARTAEASYVELAKRANGALTETSQRGAAATAAAKRTIEAIENDIATKLAIQDGPRGNEIRAHLLRLAPNERLKLAYAAIENFDKETIGAILTGPAYLSNFTDKQRDALRQRYIETQAPELLARKRVLEKGISKNLRVTSRGVV